MTPRTDLFPHPLLLPGWGEIKASVSMSLTDRPMSVHPVSISQSVFCLPSSLHLNQLAPPDGPRMAILKL